MASYVHIFMAICLWAVIQQSRGSCYQFGHACYGAHGKRSDIALLPPEGDMVDSSPDYVNSDNIEATTDQYKLQAMQNYFRNWIAQLRRTLPEPNQTTLNINRQRPNLRHF